MDPNSMTAVHDRLLYEVRELRQNSNPGTPAFVDAETAIIAIVDRVLGGDAHAFAAIVERWQGPLINMAWRYCRDRARAEEMAQEAFIRAWRGLGQWRRESSFSTWLFSVAANVYRTELKRVPAISISLDQVAEPSRPFVHDAELDGAARDEAVRRAVLALPENYREPLILFYFHEMDLATAAATMGIPEGTMKARLSRGRALLKQRFPQLREKLADNTDEAGVDSVEQSPPGQSQPGQSPPSKISEGPGGWTHGWKRAWKSRRQR
jgi:RNA polymerase sigma-70 factor (ECF subfamily)